MAKKASAERGYMTPEEVWGHAAKYPRDADKIAYLNSVLKRGKLLSEGTKKSVYEHLGELYLHTQIRKGGEDIDIALQMYEKAENWKKVGRIMQEMNQDDPKKYPLEKAADALMKGGDFSSAGHLYEHSIKDYLKAAAAYEKAGWDVVAKKMLVKHGHKLMETGDYQSAAEYFGKAEDPYWLKKAAENLPDEKRIKLLDKADRLYAQRERREDEERRRLEASKKKPGLLERIVGKFSFSGVMGWIGVLGGLCLLTPAVTGNAIASLDKTASSAMGACSFVIGIILLYMRFKR